MSITLDNYKLSCELLGHSMDVRAVAAGSKNSDVILSGSRDKTVKVWKRAANNVFSESVTFQDHKNFVACVCYMPSEGWICTGSNDATICIYMETGYVPILTLTGHESTVCSVAAGVEARSLITGSWDTTARIWTIDQMGGVTSVTLRGHEAAVWAVASMPAIKQFITGAADKCIYYWNPKGEKLRMLKGHTDCVRGVLALASSTSLVSCANDATIRHWNEDGECVKELTGHTNYIYDVAQNRALGEQVIVSCGEDSTLRMWNLATGLELGTPIVHPAQSVWSVACLANGDIVTGCSDGIVRVFTQDNSRFADETARKAFNSAVATRTAQMTQELGGIKKTDLPGPEALLSNGLREGQTKMIRHADGSVKCYLWAQGNWTLIGDVTGASGGSQESSGKTLHEGKEYDYVFSVDISDTAPPIKLPYNKGDDPWEAAQKFIHRNNLPQVYLDEVANFIVKNSRGNENATNQPLASGYQDPFTGGARYVPGNGDTNVQSGGNVDPFTGGSSYSTTASQPQQQQQPKVDVNFTKGSEKHFPVKIYQSFDNCDIGKVLDKLREFNKKLTDDSERVSETLLQAVMKLADSKPEVDAASIEALRHLLTWPSDILFPVLDVARLAVRNEATLNILSSLNFLDMVLPQLNNSVPNQLMTIRCLTNMMVHATGRKHIEQRLPALVDQIGNIRNGSANLQIAIATFYLNMTVSQTLGPASGEKCNLCAQGVVELLKWATDLEACYRAIQAIGNLSATPYGQEILAQVISVDYVMDRIRELANTPQTGAFAKINSAGSALLAAF